MRASSLVFLKISNSLSLWGGWWFECYL